MIVNRVIHKKWIKIEKRCKPLIEKRKKQKKQEFKGFFLHVPIDIKLKLDSESKRQGISQAVLAVNLIDSGLNNNRVVTTNKGVSGWLTRHKV